MNAIITVEVSIHVPIGKVWKLWTEPTHIINWNNAAPDWHTPKATNDLIIGGKFVYTMAAKDGSVSFDFGGSYTNVIANKLIEYIMDDGRKAKIAFSSKEGVTNVVETFETESVNTPELQRAGWQAILDNFKKYCEECE